LSLPAKLIGSNFNHVLAIKQRKIRAHKLFDVRIKRRGRNEHWGKHSIRRAADSWQEMLVEALVDEEEKGDDKESCRLQAIGKSMVNWLVVWNMIFLMTFHILGRTIPTDEIIFFRGVG
jgi:hypothetical protein